MRTVERDWEQQYEGIIMEDIASSAGINGRHSCKGLMGDLAVKGLGTTIGRGY